jgi:outer membrane lipoprotein-sorting protein
MMSLLLCASLWAATPSDGAGWLSYIDEVADVEDAHMVLELTVTDPRGEEAQRTIEIWQLGDEQRMVRMMAPTRLAGIGLLVTHGDTLHLYLPQFPPARRVVGSNRADAFMGTDFAVDDLARINYSDDYTAEVVGSEEGLTRLRLTPKVATGSASVEAWVGEDGVVRRLDHFNKREEVIRRITMDDIRPEAGVLLAHRMEVRDLKRNRQTVAFLKDTEINAGLSESLFSVNELENN